MASYIDFPNRRRSKWRRKNFAPFILIIVIAISTFLIFLYFPFSPKEKDSKSSDDEPAFPTIHITCYETLNKENYSNCIFELDSSEKSEIIEPMEAKIKIRGETTATYPKKGYRLELSKGESLLGMRDDDDWQLLANYYDYTRIKFKLAFNLYRSIFSLNPTAILPDSRYVLLYFNGTFQGLYLLAEKDDRKLFDLNEIPLNNTNGSLIFQAKYPSNFSIYEPDQWVQDWPNEDEGYYIMDDVMTKLISFVNSTFDEIFFNESTGIYRKFNKINLIDFFLFNYFILHKDFWNKNYLIIRNTYPSNFSLVPWDFDLSFGQNASDTVLIPTENPINEICENNLLFNRTLGNQYFRNNCSERWKVLRTQIWTNQSFSDMITTIYEECKDYMQIDLNLWNQQGDPNVYIGYLRQWISDRLYYCDYYFKNDFLIY